MLALAVLLLKHLSGLLATAVLAAKIINAPAEGHAQRAQFEREVQALQKNLAQTGDFHAGEAVRRAHEAIRAEIDFMHRDRPMDADIQWLRKQVREQNL